MGYDKLFLEACAVTPTDRGKVLDLLNQGVDPNMEVSYHLVIYTIIYENRQLKYNNIKLNTDVNNIKVKAVNCESMVKVPHPLQKNGSKYILTIPNLGESHPVPA